MDDPIDVQCLLALNVEGVTVEFDRCCSSRARAREENVELSSIVHLSVLNPALEVSRSA